MGRCAPSFRRISTGPRLSVAFRMYRVTFLRRGVVNPSPNPLPGGPPPVVCPLLLIQHICRCLPYLQVVSSIRDLRTRHALVAGTNLARNSSGVVYWIDLAQDRDRWRVLVNEILNSRVPYIAGSFLTSRGTVSFSGKTAAWSCA